MTVVGAALSEHPLATHAVGETVGHLLEVGGPRPDVVVMFVTEPHLGALDDVVGAVRHLLEPRALVGASAQSVLAGRREVMDHAAVSMLAIWFGGARIRPVRLDPVPTSDGPQLRGLGALEVATGTAPTGTEPTGTEATGTLVLLTDPFTFPSATAVSDLARRAPGLSVVGGAASSARRPGGNRLLLDGAVYDRGAVGLWIDDTTPLATVVSQGCKPIGEPFTVTAAERTMVRELAGRSALDRLKETVEGLDDHDRALAASGLLIGRVVDEMRESFGPGDFLVRGVLGADRDAGALAVADEIPVGATVQFQVRDAASATRDLSGSLTGLAAAGVLCLTDVGRGSDLFGVPDHDAVTVADALDGAAVAGAFCAGTYGPVGGRVALHDSAVSMLLVDPRPTWG